MIGHRMSALPLAQFCGASAALGKAHGGNRATELGSAFHAIQGGDMAERDARCARLTEDELDEILSWKRPADWHLPDGHVLSYDNAEKEGTLAIDDKGNPCDENAETCLSVGHFDMSWLHADCVYLGDIKRSLWTVKDGPRSLQLLAYGLIQAMKTGASYFQCGIWGATEGIWKWGPRWDIHDMRTAELVARIIASARAPEDEYVTGPHCGECYGRLHCKEHLLPVAGLDSPLAPMAEPGGITKENALDALRWADAAEKLAKKVKENLQAFADSVGGISDGNGKAWKHIYAKEEGERFNAAKFRLENPELAAKYVEVTPPKNMGFRWVREAK